MEKMQHIQELLSSLFGQLGTFTNQQRKDWEESLPLTIAALSKQDISQIRNQSIVIDRMDLFQRSKSDEKKQETIRRAIREVGDSGRTTETRVFIREVPVRSTQLPNSMPAWAAGSRPDMSYGPLPHIDGRSIFIDLYRVEKMISLYQQGNSLPAILFTGSWRTNRIQHMQGNSLQDMAREEYEIVKGSIWIKADLFATDAPQDRYFGISVANGHVKLKSKPNILNNRLMISGQNSVNVALELVQADHKTEGEGVIGLDARALEIALPDSFDFEFTAGGNARIHNLGGASWTLYGQSMNFRYRADGSHYFHPKLNRLMIPLSASNDFLEILNQQSPYLTLEGKAALQESWWALPAAVLDVNAPLKAAGSGGISVLCKEGIRASCLGQQGNFGRLNEPFFMADPGRICITDLQSKWSGAFHDIDHYKDDLNPYGTSIHLSFQNEIPFIYNVLAEGFELVMTEVHSEVKLDRPVQVNGHAFEIMTKNSVFITITSEEKNAIYLYDGNILWDNKGNDPERKVPQFKTAAIALENGLFTVSPVNACIIFGEINREWDRIVESHTFLQFGLFGYKPTLPDPYLVNYRWSRDTRVNIQRGIDGIQNWLICQLVQKATEGELDELSVSFHHANPLQGLKPAPAAVQNNPSASVSGNPIPNTSRTVVSAANRKNKSPDKRLVNSLPDYEGQYEGMFGQKMLDYFALLDVSSNANQLGVSVGAGIYGRIDFERQRETTGLAQADGEGNFNIEAVNHSGLIIEGMQVQLPATMARIFTLPQVAWEPLYNLSPPDAVEDEHGNKITMPGDPQGGFNYYPNDGGPTRIFNNRPFPVPLAPIPLSNFLLEHFAKKDMTRLEFYFTLPFGLKAFSLLGFNNTREEIKPSFLNVRPVFPENLQGGIHLVTIASNHGKKYAESNGNVQLPDNNMFAGATVQLANVLNGSGNPTGTSTLGHSVTYIFNNEFFVNQKEPHSVTGRGVPLTRMDFTGYGASTFSEWESPSAAIAQTSQAKFQIMLGRTAHEVIQVKSLIYPWGIRVVRTITVLRGGNGFVFRTDSGWQPESDGLFDFGYNYTEDGDLKSVPSPYEQHPGIISGLFNVKNIKEDPTLPELDDKNEYPNGADFINIFGEKVQLTAPKIEDVKCVPVWFDADIEIENVVQGHRNGRVPSKKILGYVQLAPAGVPLTPEMFVKLLDLQGGVIGADIDCTIDLNKSDQQMRVSRVDFTHAKDNSGLPVFVIAPKGSVFLPKDGSWTLVCHERGSGDVIPLPVHEAIPVIRTGKWILNKVIDPEVVSKNLIRLANPSEIVRNPQPDTLNFGFLQSTATQKALILTPSFARNSKKLLSKTPPLFADAYRLMRDNTIFPNIGKASDSDFGSAVPLYQVFTSNNPNIAVPAFNEVDFHDNNIKVMELLDINPVKAGEAVVEQGFKLLTGARNPTIAQAVSFEMPTSNEVELVNMPNVLRIYMDYKITPKNGTQQNSKLDFDINSFAQNAADSWKSRVKDVAMVVDLAGFERLMSIKGNFDAYKGKVPGYEGDLSGGGLASNGISVPELELSEELDTVVEILQILASLGNGDYADIMRRGLKIAMGNSGEVWEYKFEASQEIPTIQFPPGELYNDPNTPLRLEASMALGFFFNAAMKVTSDANQLLPSAGAFLQFRGGLQVMCATVSAATIYAVGKVDLKIACDTKAGPSVRMKFGFGANITVGLPVIGNVSVTYLVGADLYIASKKFQLLAVILFKGRISLAMGMVSVTIYIEAAGGVSRSGNRTECVASMTFGLEISICFVIDISFEETWQERRQIA
ncbi:MAG: hypothetical protein EA341_14845 [Mongoliibacter sp.]|uniref:hypothetical protein n=1 Tax=Mongoliibacter sp. TaxID=2022438 RepID=UPI0012F46A1F|nr:hypothetical protein [Mongoliibacter sp.]TVP45766.1 MAG: hypothetical protein EA341_14845 [Mongoliibacter sp.]